MDESIWLAGLDPDAMLDYVIDRVSERKLRLFACACCRRYWSRLVADGYDRRCQRAVEASERFADGLITLEELNAAAEAARRALMEAPQFEASAYRATVEAAAEAVDDGTWGTMAALQQMARSEEAAECVPGEDEPAAVAAALNGERQAQGALLREVFGNPFCPVLLEPHFLTWNDGCVVKMARDIYDERRFRELPILADALMDAGCQSDVLLEHLHSAGPHPLGCWALDTVLGLHLLPLNRIQRRRKSHERRQDNVQEVQEEVLDE